MPMNQGMLQLAMKRLRDHDNGRAAALAIFEALLNKDLKRLEKLNDLLVKPGAHLALTVCQDCIALAEALDIKGFTFSRTGAIIGSGDYVAALTINMARYDEHTKVGCYFELHLHDFWYDRSYQLKTFAKTLGPDRYLAIANIGKTLDAMQAAICADILATPDSAAGK